MAHIIGLGHTNDRVIQQTAADLLAGKLAQLFMHTVHGVAGLESHHICIALCDNLARVSAGVKQSSEKSS